MKLGNPLKWGGQTNSSIAKNNNMTKKNIPPHIVLKESKEVIFYFNKQFLSDIEINKWMQDFPNDFKGMVMQNGCLFNRLKEQTEN